MQVFRYDVVINGQVSYSWTSDKGGPDLYWPSFGKKARWAYSFECTPEQIATALDSKVEVINGLQVTSYYLPAEYQVVTTDITQNVKNEKIAQFQSQADAECDSEVAALYHPNSDTTELMINMNLLFEYVKGIQAVLSIEDAGLPEGAAQAKAMLIYTQETLLVQIQALRQARDEKVEAFVLTLE